MLNQQQMMTFNNLNEKNYVFIEIKIILMNNKEEKQK